MFDEQLGRWHVVDPIIQSFGPYSGMDNNPISTVDPNGMRWKRVTYWKYWLHYKGVYSPYFEDDYLIGVSMEYMIGWVWVDHVQTGASGHDLHYSPLAGGSTRGGGGIGGFNEPNNQQDNLLQKIFESKINEVVMLEKAKNYSWLKPKAGKYDNYKFDFNIIEYERPELYDPNHDSYEISIEVGEEQIDVIFEPHLSDQEDRNYVTNLKPGGQEGYYTDHKGYEGYYKYTLSHKGLYEVGYIFLRSKSNYLQLQNFMMDFAGN